VNREEEQSLQVCAKLLEKTRWADEFSWGEIENISRYLSISRISKGMAIFTEGSIGNYMCLLAEGQAILIKEDLEGQRKVLATFSEGRAIGELALFDGEPRSATVVADGPVTLLVLARENLEQLLAEHPRLGGKLLFKLGAIISQRLRMTTGRLVDLI
jgi:CRP-like cAMP-binding protein